jgi:hypothetical protein
VIETGEFSLKAKERISPKKKSLFFRLL